MRENTKEQMIQFLEDEVGKRLAELSKQRLNIEARLRYSNEVSKIIYYLTGLINFET